MKKEKRMVFTDRSHKSVDLYLKEIGKTSPLTIEEEYRLGKQIKSGDIEARNKLVEANQRFVVSEAKRFQYSGVLLEDLIMAGCEGLIKAADKFDGERGVRFLTYAESYIENEIRKEANNYIKHNCESLDEAIFGDEDVKSTRADFLLAAEGYAPDWQLRHDTLLRTIQKGVEKKLPTPHLLADYADMRERGYANSDFAKKYHLTRKQMDWFLDVVRTVGRNVLSSAA